MGKRKPLINESGEVRELDERDFAVGQSFAALPESLRRKIGQRGQQKAPADAISQGAAMLKQDVGPFQVTVEPAQANPSTGRWRATYKITRPDDGDRVVNAGDGAEYDDRDPAMIAALSLGIAIAAAKADRAL